MKKLRRVSRMSYHDIDEGSIELTPAAFSFLPSISEGTKAIERAAFASYPCLLTLGDA